MNARRYFWSSVITALGTSLVSSPAWAADTDADGVDDLIDNCVDVPNPSQGDGDSDGYGDACDGDFDDDLIVGSTDLGILKSAFLTSNDVLDLDGNGIVNVLDLGRFKLRFLVAPGPSQALPPAFTTPPEVASLQIVTPTTPGPQGQNAVVQVVYAAEEELGASVPVAVDGDVLRLNDLGLEADATAGDGTYSAYLNLDTQQLAEDQAAFETRVADLQGPVVLTYQGRTITGQAPFSGTPSSPNATSSSFAQNGLAPTALDATSSSSGSERVPPTTSSENSLSIHDPRVVAHPSYTFDPCNTDPLLSVPPVATQPAGPTGPTVRTCVANSTSDAHCPAGFTCNASGSSCERPNDNSINPDTPWSFKTLMANMIPNLSSDPVTKRQQIQKFINEWLLNWRTTGGVRYEKDGVGTNGFDILARPRIRDYFPGWDGNDPATLDVDRLPFRLLAIMNRLDLARVGYTFAGGGEIRFVFGLLDLTVPGVCRPSPGGNRMTAIFEYGVPRPRSGCSSLKQEANRWIELHRIATACASGIPAAGLPCRQSDRIFSQRTQTCKCPRDWPAATPLGSDAYMSKLKELTDTVTLARVATSFPNDKPNGSALNQLRTNETAFDGRGVLTGNWELREFRLTTSGSLQTPVPAGLAPLSAETALLRPATIKQTPDAQFRDLAALRPRAARFIEQNALVFPPFQNPLGILCEQFTVPERFENAPFLGSSIEYNSSTVWLSPIDPANLPSPALVAAQTCFQLSKGLGVSAPEDLTDELVLSEVRHKFSINACDDCHADETGTEFVHVDPVDRSFSAFLGVSDPRETCDPDALTPPPPVGTPPDKCAPSGAVWCPSAPNPDCKPITREDVTDALLGGDAHREFNDLRRRGQLLDLAAFKSCPEFLKSDFIRTSAVTLVH